MGFLVANCKHVLLSGSFGGAHTGAELGVGYGCQYLDSDAQWRIPLGIQVAPAVLLLIGMFFLPFSPRWRKSIWILISRQNIDAYILLVIEKGRNEEALAVVQRLHGNEQNTEFIKLEFAEMVEQIKYEKANMSSKLSDLWATKPMLKVRMSESA